MNKIAAYASAENLRREQLYFFRNELEKIAKPRWAKKFLQLSKKDQQRILANLGKEREIKHLGKGGERIADLVVSPVHGVAVRKIPLMSEADPRHIEAVLSAAEKQISMEHRLKQVAKKRGQFAHIVGEDAGRAYYQYVPGRRADTAELAAFKKALSDSADADAAFKRSGGFRRLRMDPSISPQVATKIEKLHHKREAARKKLYEAQLKVQSQVPEGFLSPETEQVLREMKGAYPGLHDMRKANIVGPNRTIVDLSPEMRMDLRYGESLKNPVSFSKRRVYTKKGN